MKFNVAIAALLPASALAFPQLMGANSKEDLIKMLKARQESEAAEAAELEKRQSLISGLTNTVGGLVKTLVSDVNGILGSVATGALNPNDKRPEPGYEFRPPGPGDSRGPCPGLNLLANYGYLPRNGYVNFGQVLKATADGFNMGTDLAAVLATFAVLADGDIVTESWYLGAGPNNVGGLNRHSTVEADVSPNREDFYNGCGDNHHVSSRLFAQNTALAIAQNGQYSMEVMAQQYALNAQFSKDNNPYLYYFPFPQIVSLGAFAFYPQFFSNGTYGAGGVPNYESISSIIGAKLKSDGTFEYVPERWPENWYRRSYPYGAVQALTDAFLQIYPSNIIVPGASQIGTPNLSIATLLCDVYQGINSITPLLVAGDEETVAAAAAWATSKLTGLIDPSVLGCPTSVLSPNPDNLFFPNPSSTGGPNTPPKQSARAGNNVYNKVYFKTAPGKTPKCS